MASSGTVENILPCVVTPEQLMCAEFCFRVMVNFDISAKNHPGVIQLKQILTALLNTSGGIVELTSDTNLPPGSQLLDKWMQQLQDSLSMFIPKDVQNKCMHIVQHDMMVVIFVKKSRKLITLNSNLYVRGFGRTTNTNDADGINEILVRTSSAKQSFQIWNSTHVSYEMQLSENEGSNIEFKIWERVQVFDTVVGKNTYISRLQEDRTQKTLFAFPNMENGGRLIIGVKTDTKSGANTVLGQIITENDQSLMTQFMERFLLEDQNGIRRIWGDGSRNPKMGIDWVIKYLSVTGGPPGERRMVIVIEFKHFPGGVWERTPETYFVSNNGIVNHMAFKQWKSAVTGKYVKIHTGEQVVSISTSKATQTVFFVRSQETQTDNRQRPWFRRPFKSGEHTKFESSKPTGDGFSKTCQNQGIDKDKPERLLGSDSSYLPESTTMLDTTQESTAIRTNASERNKTIHDKQMAEHSSPYENRTLPDDIDHSQIYQNIGIDGIPTYTDVVLDTNDILEHRHHLSWDILGHSAKPHRNRNIYDLNRNAHKLANKSNLLKMTTPINMSPGINTILRSLNFKQSESETAVTYVQTQHEAKACRKSFGIVTSTWTSNIPSEYITKPDKHLLDVPIVDETGVIVLWAVVENTCNLTDVWQYLFVMGRTTKKSLLHGQYNIAIHNFVDSLHVECHVYQLAYGEITPPENMLSEDGQGINFLICKDSLTHALKVQFAKLLLKQKTRIRSILGHDNSIVMTAHQMEIIMTLGWQNSTI